MTLSDADLQHLADLAVSAAAEAGAMIANSRPKDVAYKADGASLASQVVTEIDRRSESIILDTLRPTLDRFSLGLLTEEQEDDGSRFTAESFWCIDPLDGTLPFIENEPGYAVAIALVRRDGAPQIGVVYDPVEGTTWQAITGAGVYRNGSPWVAEPTGEGAALSVFADRSFYTRDDHDVLVAAFDRIAQDLELDGVQLHPAGGAVMNACGVLATAPACYVKFPRPKGGGSLWDYAATTCLFAEAGAVATDIHGRPLDLNRADSTFMNHRGVVFATDDAVADRVRALHRDAAR